MAKNENKTQETNESVDAFLATIENDVKRADCTRIRDIMEEMSGKDAKMWGESIIGFGTYHYKYASGREGDFLRVGFAPRKANISLYIMNGFAKHQERLERFGKHKTGKSCLYIKKLADVDEAILREMIQDDLDYMLQKYGA